MTPNQAFKNAQDAYDNALPPADPVEYECEICGYSCTFEEGHVLMHGSVIKRPTFVCDVCADELY